MTLQDGFQLGQYRVIGEIGRGGMGVVYRAYQPSLNRHVAVKVLDERVGVDERFRERFRREARTIAQLRHPNIVQVYDLGEQDDLLYIVMELVEGTSLKPSLGSPLPLAGAIPLVADIAAALDFAHARQVVHRDVKPANILVEAKRALLADFGIARLLGSASGLTRTGSAVGTADYMSPEQALAGDVGPASDIYSLGVITYELLTGRLPFVADSPLAVLSARIHKPPPRASSVNSDLSEEVADVLDRVLAKEPESRPSTATIFVDDLRTSAFDPKDREMTRSYRPPQLSDESRPAETKGAVAESKGAAAKGSWVALGLGIFCIGAILLASGFSFFRIGRVLASWASPVAPTASPSASSLPATAPTLQPTASAAASPTEVSTPTPKSPTPSPTSVPTADDLWIVTESQLDTVWGTDWPRSIALLETFLNRFPEHAPAKDKLYGALVAYGTRLVQSGSVDARVAQFIQAQALLANRGEAAAALIALTPAASAAAPTSPAPEPGAVRAAPPVSLPPAPQAPATHQAPPSSQPASQPPVPAPASSPQQAAPQSPPTTPLHAAPQAPVPSQPSPLTSLGTAPRRTPTR